MFSWVIKGTELVCYLARKEKTKWSKNAVFVQKGKSSARDYQEGCSRPYVHSCLQCMSKNEEHSQKVNKWRTFLQSQIPPLSVGLMWLLSHLVGMRLSHFSGFRHIRPVAWFVCGHGIFQGGLKINMQHPWTPALHLWYALHLHFCLFCLFINVLWTLDLPMIAECLSPIRTGVQSAF